MNATFAPNRYRTAPAGGFTLLEMMITLAIFILLAAAVFGMMTGVLQSTSSLQDNQNRRDQIVALNAFLKNKLGGHARRKHAQFLPARRRRGLDAKRHHLRQHQLGHGDRRQGAAQRLLHPAPGHLCDRGRARPAPGCATGSFSKRVTTDDPTLAWTPLITDSRRSTGNSWISTSTALGRSLEQSTKPNLVEFSMQPAGDLQPTTMDFWVPKIDPISVSIAPAAHHYSLMRAHPLFSRRGSALILVLWCLLLLGMAVFGVVEMVELSVEHTSHEERALEARGLALSGVALGLNPQLLKDDPLLAQKPAADGQFKVTIGSEGARLNLNYVLLSKHREILENLFTQWGLQVDQADHVADCLYDWVTPGDLHSLNGAKADDYAQADLPQRPTYKPFDSFDEVKLVMGMDLVEKAKPELAGQLYPLEQRPAERQRSPAGTDRGRLQPRPASASPSSPKRATAGTASPGRPTTCRSPT